MKLTRLHRGYAYTRAFPDTYRGYSHEVNKYYFQAFSNG